MIAVILGFVSLFFDGWVLMLLWRWFPCNSLDAPPLSYGHCLGLIFFCQALVYATNTADITKLVDSDEKRQITRIFYSLCLMMILLGFGFVTHLIVN